MPRPHDPHVATPVDQVPIVERIVEVPVIVEVPRRVDKLRDLAARAGWTAAQSGLAVITVESLDIPVAWAVPVAWALSAIKTFIAGRVGDPNTNEFR